ncbi:GL22884 [Drosophila persimilis]|uniref:Protein aurora borealis n=1 Tax=Drosophila persimilis TaxID=7234 RepID=B4GZY7_DROPE|nr:GL22884 [Drosophila persimilis]
MYTDEVRTPQALKSRYFTNLGDLNCRTRRNSATGNSSVASAATPTNGGKQNTKCSPQMSTLVCTPPPKRFHKIRNPFEGALADRLHLPLIASPSLFRARTPQLSSTQFEWNIDEVSQLTPADVEPHETQFHDSPDPELESKAQMAISAFFKESLIVPSPVDCPLRKNRIILNADHTPISNKSSSGRRGRDCSVQTELTLPPILPKALEEALRPYLQPHLAGGTSGRFKSRSSGSDVFNSSMRRKLFDLHNVIVLGEKEAAQSPQMVGSSPQGKQTMFAGRLSDSASAVAWCTPKVEASISSNEQHDTLSELTGTGRPACRFTPDRSSSPMQALEHSDSSINQRVSRLRVNSTRQLPSQSFLETVDQALFEEVEADDTDEPEADPESDEDEEEAEAMQLSTISFNCSSSNSDTPRGHRRHRSANRKNLSQSFSANLEEVEAQRVKTAPPVINPPAQRIGLYRVDSGFNETSIISTFACSQDISMACCSTPSTRP